MQRAVVAALALLSLTTLAGADQVTMINGDLLTGKVVKLDSGKLTVQPAYADAIAINWDAVKRVVADQPLFVLAGKDREVSATSIERVDSELLVTEASGSELRVPAAAVSMLRSPEERRAYEASLHPGLRSNWAGGSSVGFALARGNSRTVNLALGLGLTRQTLKDKVSLYANTVYAADHIRHTTTANVARGGARYDRDVNRRLFGFVGADFESDELQLLDLRTSIGGGAGWHAIAAPRLTVDVLGGGAWTRESYDTGKRNFAAAQVGDEVTLKLWAGSELKQRAFIYPDLDRRGEYRLAFDVAVSSKLYKFISWQTSLSDRYVTNPPPGKEGNDLLLSTGLALSIGRK